ncbi:STE3-domain-containing protein [Peniophora sp. CONT]|nr:STE3-domain-containing protein [Peniophora sp. CONT]
MVADDPTYPLYPISCTLAAALLLLSLLTSICRQSWNLGVTLLCFWLLVQNLINATNAILWADNGEIKLFVWCDIVTRLNLASNIGLYTSTLLITRRLHLIVRFQATDLSGARSRVIDRCLEWGLGIVYPLVNAGPVYYVIQGARFQVEEGAGCNQSISPSILAITLIQVWTVLPPLVSVVVYYPKVAYTFYRHNRDVNRFLRSNDSIPRTSYLRVLAVASIDTLLTLPIGLISFVFFLRGAESASSLPFYAGWKETHTHWDPIKFSYEEVLTGGSFNAANFYWQYWMAPGLALVIFGLFGFTVEARASYWRAICAIRGCFGWKPTLSTRDMALGVMEFGLQPMQEVSFDAELWPRTESFISSPFTAVIPNTRSDEVDTTSAPDAPKDMTLDAASERFIVVAFERDKSDCEGDSVRIKQSE